MRLIVRRDKDKPLYLPKGMPACFKTRRRSWGSGR